MAIKYKMIKQNDNINPEDEKKVVYYPRVVRVLTRDIKRISKITAAETTFDEIEIEAAVRILVRRIERELLDSNHVCLDGFGTFSLTAECRSVDDPDDVRAESIKVKRVVFIPSKQLMKRIKNAEFVRAK